MSEKQNLSKTELAAVDLMIAYMQEHKLSGVDFPGIAIIQTISDAFSMRSSDFAKHVINVTTGLSPLKNDEQEGNGSKELEKQLTLEQLLAIRNNNS